MIERRKTRRYDLTLPAIVNSNVGAGRTKDISTGGAFLVLRQPIKNDTDFNLMIELPTGVYVRATARAVRTQEWTEQGKRVVGIGAAIKRREIVRPASNESGSHQRSL